MGMNRPFGNDNLPTWYMVVTGILIIAVMASLGGLGGWFLALRHEQFIEQGF